MLYRKNGVKRLKYALYFQFRWTAGKFLCLHCVFICDVENHFLFILIVSVWKIAILCFFSSQEIQHG